MPVCKYCGKVAATVEMRRSPLPDGGYLCKDKSKCKKTKEGK